MKAIVCMYVDTRLSVLYTITCFREHGQGTTEELRSRDFRKDLEDREKEKTGARDRRMPEAVSQLVWTDFVLLNNKLHFGMINSCRL